MTTKEKVWFIKKVVGEKPFYMTDIMDGSIRIWKTSRCEAKIFDSAEDLYQYVKKHAISLTNLTVVYGTTNHE